MIEEIRATNAGLTVEINGKKTIIPCLMFVDDILLMAKNTKDLEKLINKMNEEFVKMFAVSNMEKTEIMARYGSDRELEEWLVVAMFIVTVVEFQKFVFHLVV